MGGLQPELFEELLEYVDHVTIEEEKSEVGPSKVRRVRFVQRA